MRTPPNKISLKFSKIFDNWEKALLKKYAGKPALLAHLACILLTKPCSQG